jgi:CubicO group peptidase (beta-lactamase class C family)
MPLHRRDCVFGIAVLAATAGASRAAAQTDPSMDWRPAPAERAAMDQLAERFCASNGVPGMTVCIARRGAIVYDSAFGLADPATGEKLGPNGRFRIASVTKPITAAAIFTLVESRRLRISSKVFGRDGVLGADYPIPPQSHWLSEITVDHLLTHSAGGWTNDGNDPMFREPGLDHHGLIAWTLANQPLQNRPGTKYAYSNFGYCLLGRVIEKVSGQRYDDYVRDRVLAPSGITDMQIAGNTLAERGRHEVRYTATNGGSPYGMNVHRMDSHGGWIATAYDIVRFLTHVDGTSPRQLLGSATQAMMSTPSAINAGYARGWASNKAGNYWHTGLLPGTTTIAVRTRSRFCWAALCNAGGPGSGSDFTGQLDRLVWDMVREVPRWDA